MLFLLPPPLACIPQDLKSKKKTTIANLSQNTITREGVPATRTPRPIAGMEAPLAGIKDALPFLFVAFMRASFTAVMDTLHAINHAALPILWAIL